MEAFAVQAVAQAAGSGVVPGVEAGKGIYRGLKLKYDMVRNVDKNFSKLLEVETDLNDREDYVLGEIEREKHRMKATREAETWLDRVKNMKQDINVIKHRYSKIKAQRCLCRIYPFCSILKLSKDIVQTVNDIDDLKEKSKPENVMTQREPSAVQKTHPTKADAVRNNVDTLLDYLQSPDIKKIGIWGPPGVGKTMTMKTLNDQLETDVGVFDLVMWVTVGKEFTIEKVQQVIMERLNLNLVGNPTSQQVATHISTKLEHRRYLLLLDQVFSVINLHEVGIYDGHGHGKIVLASRSKIVCTKMDVNEYVPIEKLSRGEALDLFRGLVGDDIFNHGRIKPIAELLVKECGDLPQVIKAVASSLKEERRDDIWRHKLSRLRSSCKDQLRDMEEALNAFEVIYEDDLETPQKNCLKFAALFAEDYEIYQDHLIECWKAQNIIGSQTFRKAREEGYAILKDLNERCLLEKGRSMAYVKMSIICRKMALGKYDDKELLVGATEGTHQFLSAETWSQTKMISLMRTNLRILPDRPECNTLSTLLLQKNKNLVTIPDDFFALMSTLTLLDLYCTGIETLPLSISRLTNLQGLYLNNCHFLMTLPDEIRRLTDLEVLDVRRTGIRSLPIWIGELSKLRCLRVSFTSCAGNQNPVIIQPPGNVIIAPNLIGKLTLLEELLVDVDLDEPGWNNIVDTIATEIASLKLLTSLCFYFPRLDCFESFNVQRQSRRSNMNGPTTTQLQRASSNMSADLNNFRSFKIQVGSDAQHYPGGRLDVFECSPARHLRYTAGKDISPAIKELLAEASSFDLIHHENARSLSDFGDAEIQWLEACRIEQCPALEKIVVGDGALPYLQKLHIFGLQSLNCICEDSSTARSFICLTTLILKDCSSITKIFSWGMIHQFKKLEHLTIENCDRLTEVIEPYNQSGQITQVEVLKATLPRLKLIELINLQNLKRICAEDKLGWPMLKKLEIKDCQRLEHLSLTKDNAKSLSCIMCNEGWWTQLTFYQIDVKPHLTSRCRFR